MELPHQPVTVDPQESSCNDNMLSCGARCWWVLAASCLLGLLGFVGGCFHLWVKPVLLFSFFPSGPVLSLSIFTNTFLKAKGSLCLCHFSLLFSQFVPVKSFLFFF